MWLKQFHTLRLYVIVSALVLLLPFIDILLHNTSSSLLYIEVQSI